MNNHEIPRTDLEHVTGGMAPPEQPQIPQGGLGFGGRRDGGIGAPDVLINNPNGAPLE